MRQVRFFIVVSAALIAAGCMRQPAPSPMAAGARPDLDALAYGGYGRTPQGPAAYQGSSPAYRQAAAYAPAPRESTYTLDSGDRLRVTVYGQDGLTNSYSVDAGGNITMPLIGSVKARGMSTTQLSAAVAAKLRQGYMREPYVAVEVEAYRPFFILGEVTYPGQYPYVVDMTVETAVAIAGGFSPRAERTKVQISRNQQGEQVRWSAPTATPVKPGDTVVVGERWF